MVSKAESLELTKEMKNFNKMTTSKGTRYINYLHFIKTEIENHTECIALLMEHQKRLEEVLPDLEELKKWNIVRGV